MTGVSVIVPARDAAATIAATLRALEAQTADAEVIVVDNGSLDETARIARESALSPRVIELPRGAGPGTARNAGATAASGALLAFTDADCEPDPGWLAAGMQSAVGADLIQGVVTPTGPAGPFDRIVSVSGRTGLYETANLFVSKETFERAGGFREFDDDVGAPFGEDAAFGWRCVRLGAREAFAREAVVRHEVFERGPGGYVKERWRRRYFPALVRAIPELRRAFLYRRVFLTRRGAAFDLAVVGLALALALGSLCPLVAALPYLAEQPATLRRWRRRAPLVLIVDVAADAVSAVALVYGSARARRVVL